MGFQDNFVPTGKSGGTVVAPYYEDARADYAPYWASESSLVNAKAQVIAEITKLGGAIIAFDEGYFDGRPRRRGFIVRFVMQDKEGRFKVAGLPIRSETPRKIDRVLVQALLVVRDWLRAGVTATVFSPGNNPLIPHLLGKSGKTFAEMIALQQNIDSGDLSLLEG